MKCSEDKNFADDYIDNLQPDLETHLKECTICSSRLKSIHVLQSRTKNLPDKINPESDLWSLIFSEITVIKQDKKQEEDRKEEELRILNTPSKAERKRRKRISRKELINEKLKYLKKKNIIFYSGAGSVIILLLIYFFLISPGSHIWQVIRADGRPEIEGDIIVNAEYMDPGETVSTDYKSRAIIDISQMGKIHIKPSSRLQRIDNNSCKLEYGSIQTDKNNSGDLFYVEIPAGIVRDLIESTNYYIETEISRSFIKVLSGRAFLGFNENDFYLLPHFSIEYRKGIGPGLPLSDITSVQLRLAAEEYSFKGKKRDALDNIIKYSRTLDAPTLWNLVAIVPDEDRYKVITKLTSLVAPPSGVIRDAVFNINDEVRFNWLNKIEKEIAPLNKSNSSN